MIANIAMLFMLWKYCAFGAVINSLTEPHQEWTVQNSNKSVFVKLTSPSGIYSDLLKTNIIQEDILYGFNDIKYRWIGNDSWTYSVNFTVDENIKFTQSVELIFHGLDGFASIFLNKKFLGQAMNTFVRYRYDITDNLRKTNALQIEFQSPIKSGIIRSKNAAHSVPPSCVPVTYKGECHVNFLRRMQASFAWDWGPAFPSIGIWKPIELVYRKNDLIIRDIVVKTFPYNDVWKLTAKVHSEVPTINENFYDGYIYLSVSSLNEPRSIYTVFEKIVVKTNLVKKEIITSLTMNIPERSVKLWWPNGYGDQHLYELSATFASNYHQGNVTKAIQIGFRTVELIQDYVDENDPQKGRSFYFKVNGIPIFAKGSNYIPSNILLENSSNEKVIQELLESSKNANMNMLRVWGGGIYESDYFYQLCDKYGIMIWQDMMFACNMYPVDIEFLSLVEQEISQQIRRLQYHPSIVIWAGNNENEAALSGNWYNTASNYSLYKEEYVKLYVNTIQENVLKIDNTRTYLISSPTNGIETLLEDYVSKNPYNPLYGDVHYYNYFKNSWMINNFPFTRFSSEYGFQSLPSLSTWKEVATREDISSLNTKFMDHRQHLPLGSLYLIYLMLFHFPLPLLTDIENLIYISQINQAWSVKLQTEWYRKWRNVLLPDGRGQTMGALYWQLNDIWQAPSWSSIEYGGKWKMLQYYAKHFFAPVLIAADLAENKSISINIVSDLLYDVPNVILSTEIFKWDSFAPVDVTTETITVKRESSTIHKLTNVSELIDSKPNCHTDIAGKLCFLKLALLHKGNHSVISENYLFPISFKSAYGIQQVNIKVTVNTIHANTCSITLTTDAISLFVWLDAREKKVIFSDNGFVMTQPQKVVEVRSKDIDCSTLENLLRISVLDAKRLSKLTNSITQQFLYSRIINPFA